jgi:hypothetical protein
MQAGGAGGHADIDEEREFAQWDEQVLATFGNMLYEKPEEPEMEWEDVA